MVVFIRADFSLQFNDTVCIEYIRTILSFNGVNRAMLTIIQRVTNAQVVVNEMTIGKINQGIMALVAIEKEDGEKEANRLLERILNYRIFADESDKMNLSLRDINGGLLIIPQFTLAADTRSGNRPSFSKAAPPEKGQILFRYFSEQAKQKYPSAEFGQFGADMKVSLINDGPVTFTLTTG
jgi:D-tyrosyl-tRNA(Tyr) deacylase